jgi:hypothetical protein
MNPIVIDIPGVGPVEFPATMSQDQINAAAKKLHDEANKEPVVEKESPEALGGMVATLGGIGAAGDVIYSKGRPLFRMAEKAMGMDSGAPTVKPRTFLDPSTVAQKAIERRTTPPVDVTGSPSAVKNWGLAEHKGEFLGGSEYGEADKIKKEALAFEKQNPTQKVLPGSLLAVPDVEAKQLAQQRAELATQQDKIKQAEVQAVAQKRAERLGERASLKGQENKFNMAKGAGSLGAKAALPVLGGYQAGAQGAQAYNRLTRPDLSAGDVASGLTNVVGSATGAASMVPSRFRIPAAIISQGANAIADFLDKRNPRNEEIEIQQKAAGGLAHLAEGGGPKLPGKFGKAASVLGTALKPLARAPAKSKAEIEAIAQRMAPQELGEFVKAPGKTTSVSGASKKQYDRELGLQHDIRNVIGTQGLPEIDYHKRIGDVAMMLPGDKSIVGDIHRVGDLQLEKAVRAEGGKGFPVNYALENPNLPPELWTSTGQVAKNYQNLGRKVAQEYGAENVLPHYANMPMGMGYSQHFADTLLRGLRPAGADLGKATDMMRTGSFKGKSFPDFPGFENMDEVYEMMKHNPELRQLFTNRIQVQDVAKSLGLPPTYGADALHAVTSPSLRNLETGAGGHMVGRLDLQRQMTPSTHKGYIPDRDPGLNIPGEAIGKTPYATPYEMLYPDLLNDIRTNPITYENKTGKAMIVPEFGRLKMDSPRQVIDPQFADEMAMYKEAMKKLTGKATGGTVQNFQAGGLSKLAKHVHSQNPKVAQALEEYLKGNISQEERIRIMNQFLPTRQWKDLPPNYTDEQIKNALLSNKQYKALAPVPEGMQVGNRLDIPAYTQHGVYVDTTHDAAGKPISYNRTGHLKGVEFSSKPNQAVRVGLGTKEQALTPMGAEIGSAKSPFALIKGTNVGTKDDEVRRMMAEMMQDPRYTQIGMDPRKHSQFYDKSTGMPVFSAEEKLQSGPLIIAPKKGLETTSWDDPRLNLSDFEGKKYAPGGKVGALTELAKKLMPQAERQANKAKYLEGNHPAVPEVVYHATRATPKGQAIDQMIGSKFGTLGSGTYTTPSTKFGSTYTGIPTPETIEELKTSFPAMARPFVKAMEEGDFSGVPMGGYMMPLHPSVKNPLILQGVHADPAYEALAKLGVPDNKIDSIVEKANDKYGSIGKEIQSRAQKAGHDGVILYKDGNIQEMVTYSPYQLKSAIGNEGTFNPYDPNLSKKRGGKVKKK